ncbi:MAG TPA: LysE family translocator [Hyphomonas sp.]|nr:LysE family translocator [Hyphomonas sp.]
MDLTVWLALVALFFAGGLTPGPAVMLVMSTSLRYRAPTALIPALGVSAANLVWISLAAGGLAAFAAKFPLVLIVLKVAGICFIAWLAFTIAFADPSRPHASASDAPPRGKLFARGVGLQLLNPNALVFFGLLLPSYFDMAKPVVPQALVMMATITACEMFGLTVYAWLADAMNHRFESPAFTKWFNRGAAFAMLAAVIFASVSTVRPAA